MSAFADRWAPHLILAALCVGLASANAFRPGTTLAIAGLLTAVAVAVVARGAPARIAVCAGLLIAGSWWAGARLDAIDQSVLAPEIGPLAARSSLSAFRPRLYASAGVRCASPCCCGSLRHAHRHKEP